MPLTDNESEQGEGYLATFRRIPPAILLEIASRGVDPGCAERCYCGLSLRVAVAERLDVEVEGITDGDIRAATGALFVVDGCVNVFGGSRAEWQTIYDDAANGPALVADAFTIAVLEACHAPA